MTIKSSGTISIADIATELGIGANGLGLNDSRVRSLAGIPSGPISLASLYGKSNAKLVNSYDGTGAIANSVGTASASAVYRFNSDGTTSSGSSWFAPATAGIGTSYWCKASLVSGQSPTFGATGAWIQLSTGPSWSNTTGTGSIGLTKTSTLRIDIAASSGGAILETGLVTVTANRGGIN